MDLELGLRGVGYIKGVVYDEDRDTIPFATVFISDRNGKLVDDKSRVKTNLDGEYVLPLSSKGSYIKVMANTYPEKIIPLPIGNDKLKEDIDITLDLNTQMLPEFTVIGEKPSWFKKNKWWVIGGGALALALGTLLIIKNKNK